VTISSQPLDYLTISNDVGFIAQDISTISDDVITVDLSNISSDTITLTGSHNTAFGYSAMTTGSYTVGSGGAGISAISINDLSASTFIWKSPEEWVDCFPDYERIQKMCDMYPGLKIAFERFKTTYKLVQDDYDSPPGRRIKP
jgi:hypothetical protein